MWKRKLEAEAVKFFWMRKHFEERSWKRKQTRKRLTLYGAGSGSKKYSTASASLWKRKRLNFFGSGSTLKKESGSGSD